MSELSYESTSEFLATPKGALHYHVAGDGPPLLMLHGSGPGVSGWANFGGNLPAFARDFTTYLLDLPGFGKSYSVSANPLPAAPGAVLDFLDGLALGPLPIVGNSMGGAVAARIAAQHPERVARLVALGGVGLAVFSPSPPEGIKLLVEFVEDPTLERLVAWMESMVYDSAILTDEFVQQRWKAATDPDTAADLEKLYNRSMLSAMRRTSGAADQVAMLTNIKAPTLLMFGRDDRVTPLDSALVAMRLIRKCELHVFYDCGHWAMIERKDEFESTTRAFLLRDVRAVLRVCCVTFPVRCASRCCAAGRQRGRFLLLSRLASGSSMITKDPYTYTTIFLRQDKTLRDREHGGESRREAGGSRGQGVRWDGKRRRDRDGAIGRSR